MRVIWKYKIDIDAKSFILELPIISKPLYVGVQNCTPYVWIEVEKFAKKTNKQFMIVGTGHTIPMYANYIGTYQDSVYVQHLYQID